MYSIQFVQDDFLLIGKNESSRQSKSITGLQVKHPAYIYPDICFLGKTVYLINGKSFLLS